MGGPPSPPSALDFAPLRWLPHPPTPGASPKQEGLMPGGHFCLQIPSVPVGGGLQGEPDLPGQPLLPLVLATDLTCQAGGIAWGCPGHQGARAALWPFGLVDLFTSQGLKPGSARSGGRLHGPGLGV